MLVRASTLEGKSALFTGERNARFETQVCPPIRPRMQTHQHASTRASQVHVSAGAHVRAHACA
eukprot:5261468-Alexandrium_andersonii.AAC.1